MALFAVLTSALAACGGDATTPTPPSEPPLPPPPTGPGTPASLSIAAGDGQVAEPETVVATNPGVLVRDAQGRAVPGVSVTFAIDSGAGTIDSASATTDASGIARSGPWRLGRAVGPNVLRATAGGLAPLRFRADARFAGTTRTLLPPQIVGVGGGTLRYDRPGDPLSGLTITVPSGSFGAEATWSVTADSSVLVPLPADFSQVGPVLVVNTGAGYADSLMLMTVPVRVSGDDAVAAFFFDQTSGTLEGIPSVAQTDSTLTFASRHFAGGLMAIPGAAPASRLVAATGTFGTMKIVFVKIPRVRLRGTYTTGFVPGTDDWEFVNYGSWLSPRGNCNGMSVTAMYYHYFHRAAGRPALFGQFDRFLGNQFDNVRGIHFAESVQYDYSNYFDATLAQRKAFDQRVKDLGQTVSGLAETWLLLNLKLTRRPVLLALYGSIGGHAVVVNEARATAGLVRVGFADPNQPGVQRSLTYVDGELVPVSAKSIASGPENRYTETFPHGVTSDIPLTQLHARWAEFLVGTAGEEARPRRELQRYDSAGGAWVALTDTVRLLEDTLKLRANCPACRPNGTDGIYYMGVLQPTGEGIVFDTAPRLVLAEENASFFVMAMGLTGGPFDESLTFLDGRFLTVLKGKLRLFPAQLSGKPDTAYTFTATHGGLAGPTTRFRWNFGDGSAVQTTVGDSIRSHTFAEAGTYTVSVEMRDASDRVLGRSTSEVTIASANRWRLTSFSQVALTNTFPANHQATVLMWERTSSSNELRDSILARPGGAILQLLPGGSVHPVGYRHPDEEFDVYRATVSSASPAMFLTYPRGPQLLAEAVGAVGPGFALLPAQSYAFSFQNSYQRTTSGPVSFSGSAANWTKRQSTFNEPACGGPPGLTGGAPYSGARSFMAFNASSTPAGLSGTITVVTQFAAAELQATPTVCWWQPMAEIRRTFTFTAVPLP